MKIDESAPATARAEIEIAAPIGHVWSVLTDIAAWPRWNPDVKAASLDGPLDVGTRFRWKAGPGTITSVIRAVEPPRLIGWTGKTLGVQAVHVYGLEQRGDVTVVTSEESWSGPLARLFRGRMATSLQRGLDSGLAHLKAEAERPTSAAPV